jgi:uncharacterized repeat protein (TIGR03943 family)
MKRETQNILLVLLGGALLKIALNGTYLRYVKPSQQPWLITAGAVMVIIAFVSIFRDIKAARRTEVVETGDHHEHRSYSTWLLLLPVFAVFLIAPPALGADSVNRAEGRTPPPTASDFRFAALPPGDVIDLRFKDFVERAGWDKEGTLNNRKIRLTGFVVQQNGSTYVARMAIGCCAADAYPVRVKLYGPGLDTLANDTWITATVTFVPGTANKDSRYIPTSTIADYIPATEPEDPYEY